MIEVLFQRNSIPRLVSLEGVLYFGAKLFMMYMINADIKVWVLLPSRHVASLLIEVHNVCQCRKSINHVLLVVKVVYKKLMLQSRLRPLPIKRLLRNNNFGQITSNLILENS